MRMDSMMHDGGNWITDDECMNDVINNNSGLNYVGQKDEEEA